MAKITFIGTGEAFDPALPNTSVLYEGERRILMDCGYSVPHAFWRYSTDPDFLDAIYLTHIHADHSFGLPALLLWMRLAGRKKAIRILGGPGLENWLNQILNLAYPGAYGPDKCFPIEALSISPTKPLQWGAIQIKNAASNHKIRNLAIRIDEPAGSLCYSGDGGPTEETRKLFEGCDVLIHECYSRSAQGPNHASAEELIPMATTLGVGALYLLHLSANEKPNIRELVQGSRSAFTIKIPKPGDSLDLQKTKEPG